MNGRKVQGVETEFGYARQQCDAIFEASMAFTFSGAARKEFLPGTECSFFTVYVNLKFVVSLRYKRTIRVEFEKFCEVLTFCKTN